jgi:opacity protein-like surface antigen
VRPHRQLFATFAVATLLIAGASAFPARSEQSSDKAEFDITPYVWAAGLNGSVGIGKLPAQGVEASFSDLVQDLHFAAMGTFRVRKGDWGAIIDAVYFDLHDTVPTPDQVVYGQADVTLGEQLYTGFVIYRIYEAHKTTVDLVWGGRYVRLDTDLSLTGGVAQGRSASATVTWWDWLAGVNVVGHPSPRWSWLFHADLGGGGSQFTWEGIAGADFAFNKTVSLAFGYRYLSIDYDENGLLYDLGTAGPYLGVGFHF